jgi:hypothetical protein
MVEEVKPFFAAVRREVQKRASEQAATASRPSFLAHPARDFRQE